MQLQHGAGNDNASSSWASMRSSGRLSYGNTTTLPPMGVVSSGQSKPVVSVWTEVHLQQDA
jgi:hypothetical protein